VSTVDTTTALWITGAHEAAHRETRLDAGTGHLEIETLFTGISRGTERLVFEGRVPESEWETMRAPFQGGDLPFPVKYGYAAVGRILSGPRAGEMVFALFPHQARFNIPHQAAIRLPDAVPASRAVLAANMETALNILWDAQVQPGDRVAVIGCGVLGALAGYLAAKMPGTEVCLIDIDPARAPLAKTLGCKFAPPAAATDEADVVVHASASAAGLACALTLAGMEATIVEASWYGAGTTPVPLGGRYHQRRLRLVSSQVGRIPAGHAARWTHRRRLEKALSLLADPVLDALISGETSFADLPARYGAILEDPATLCHRVRYGEKHDS
jgi:hypothetical protein